MLLQKLFQPIDCCAVATFAGSTAGPAVAFEGSMINFYSYIYGIILYSYSFRLIFYLYHVLEKKYFLSLVMMLFENWPEVWYFVTKIVLNYCEKKLF